MKIYEALYNPMIYESGWETLSIHKSKQGAEKAIAIHKAFVKKEFDEKHEDYKVGEWDDFQAWDVNETELKD